MKRKLSNKKGFTLVETMVAVAILAIIGAVSVTAYQDYTVKVQLAEGISVSSGAKIAVSEYFYNNNKMPRTADDMGFDLPNDVNNIESMYVDRGVIVTTFNDSNHKLLKNRLLILTPVVLDVDNIIWNCQSTIAEKFLPHTCSSVPDDLNQALISNPNSSLLYTLEKRMRWFNAYYEEYQKGVRKVQESVKDENGSLLAKGADPLEQLLTNAYMMKMFFDGLREDGYPETLMPDFPEIKLSSKADSDEAQQLLSNYFGKHYDNSIFWNY